MVANERQRKSFSLLIDDNSFHDSLTNYNFPKTGPQEVFFDRRQVDLRRAIVHGDNGSSTWKNDWQTAVNHGIAIAKTLALI